MRATIRRASFSCCRSCHTSLSSPAPVAIAYAREGADTLVSHLDEVEDANATKKLIEEAGRKAVLVPGELQDASRCRAIVERNIGL